MERPIFSFGHPSPPSSLFSDPHFHHLMVLGGLHGILALGLTLFPGDAGQISLGHTAFFGIGTYTTAILTARHG